MTQRPARRVAGAKAIAEELARIVGTPISTVSVHRWARRDRDALPLLRFTVGRRSQLLADVDALEQWVARRVGGLS